jgi:hypothetical protein
MTLHPDQDLRVREAQNVVRRFVEERARIREYSKDWALSSRRRELVHHYPKLFPRKVCKANSKTN